MITVTETAENRIKYYLDKEGNGCEGIRVSVKKTGCSGYMYVFDFVQNPPESDIVIKGSEYKIFIDTDAVKYLEGSTLDYQKKFLNESFEFINPNEAARCGCGESFTV